MNGSLSCLNVARTTSLKQGNLSNLFDPATNQRCEMSEEFTIREVEKERGDDDDDDDNCNGPLERH